VLQVPREEAPGFSELGLVAFTTTREAGSFNLGAADPVADVHGRWWDLVSQLSALTRRLASAHQTHGTDIVVHGGDWHGWLCAWSADGHASFEGRTAMAVSLADCVPVFVGHASGAAAILHSGWRGTAARIVNRALTLFASRGLEPADLLVHLGPAICGACYVVGPEVCATLTGETPDRPSAVDLRALLALQAKEHGVRKVTVSSRCTRCDNDRFFSHRAHDAGRQLGVIVSANA